MNENDSRRLRAKPVVVGLAACVAEVLSIIILFAAQIFAIATSTTEFAIFGAVTTVLVTEWLEVDARNAFEVARRKGFLGHEKGGGKINEVKANCPHRWLVRLHLRLHTELVAMAFTSRD